MCQMKLEKKEHYLMVTLNGEFTLGSTSEIKEKVKGYAEANQVYRLIVDLSEVSFMDSSGLGALIAWFKMVNEHQGKIVFNHPTDYVRKIMGYAKLDKILDITDSFEEAKALM